MTHPVVVLFVPEKKTAAGGQLGCVDEENEEEEYG